MCLFAKCYQEKTLKVYMSGRQNVAITIYIFALNGTNIVERAGLGRQLTEGRISLRHGFESHYRHCARAATCASHERSITAVTARVVDGAFRHRSGAAPAAPDVVVPARHGAAQRSETRQRDHDIYDCPPDCADRHAAQYAVPFHSVCQE